MRAVVEHERLKYDQMDKGMNVSPTLEKDAIKCKTFQEVSPW